MSEERDYKAGIVQLEDLMEMIKAIIHPDRRLDPKDGSPHLDFSYGQWCILHPDSDYRVAVGLETYIPETYDKVGDQDTYLPGFGLVLNLRQSEVDLLSIRLVWSLNDRHQVELCWVAISVSLEATQHPELLIQRFGDNQIFEFMRQIDSRVFEGDLFRQLNPDTDSTVTWRIRDYFERFFYAPYRQAGLPIQQLLYGMMTNTEDETIRLIEEKVRQDAESELAT